MSVLTRVPALAVKEKTVITISSGAVTVDQQYHAIAAESGTADNLDTITLNYNTLVVSGTTYRPILWITADTGDTITLKNGTGNIQLTGGTDLALTDGEFYQLVWDGTNWLGQVNTGNSGSSTGALTEAVATYTTSGSADASWTISGWSASTNVTRLVFELYMKPSATSSLILRPNSDTTAANYYGMTSVEYSTTITANSVLGGSATLSPGVSYFSSSYGHPVLMKLEIFRPNNATYYKNFLYHSSGEFTSPFDWTGSGWWESASAMTSLYVAPSTGNFAIGSGYRVYES